MLPVVCCIAIFETDPLLDCETALANTCEGNKNNNAAIL
tara:strand:- start:776 stop:892 length:117 start_codon:yes stop_codon:yes gene_type:complete